MDKIKEFWKDPVWSKIISVGILAFMTFIYAKIKSISENNSVWDVIYALWDTIYNFEIKVIYIILLVIVYRLAKNIIFRNKNSLKIKQQILKDKVNKIKDTSQGIMVRCDVYFDVYNKPQVFNVVAFCLKHGEPPLKMSKYGGCTDPNCENSTINNYSIQNFVESIVINEWDKINDSKI